LTLKDLLQGAYTSTSSSSGTTGTHDTTRGLASGEVINNYYGPVYFVGTGEPGAYYDCPSPNPLMQATSGSLATSAI